MLKNVDNVTLFPGHPATRLAVAEEAPVFHHIQAQAVPASMNEKFIAKYLEIAALDTLSHEQAKRMRTVVKRKQRKIEVQACSFALHKVDEALAMIGNAYTRHEGIYGACLYSLLDLDDIEQLPLATQVSIAVFLNTLAPEADMDRFDQARATVASLTETGVLQFIDDLLSLRQHLEEVRLELYKPIHGGFSGLIKWAPPSFDNTVEMAD